MKKRRTESWPNNDRRTNYRHVVYHFEEQTILRHLNHHTYFLRAKLKKYSVFTISGIRRLNLALKREFQIFTKNAIQIRIQRKILT